MLKSLMIAVPEVGGIEPLRQLNNVVFPAPLGPNNPKHSLALIIF